MESTETIIEGIGGAIEGEGLGDRLPTAIEGWNGN